MNEFAIVLLLPQLLEKAYLKGYGSLGEAFEDDLADCLNDEVLGPRLRRVLANSPAVAARDWL